MVGRTGTGKSTLLERLILSRRDTVVIQTKKDPIKFEGKLVTKADDIAGPIDGGPTSRYVLRPQFDSVGVQRKEIRDCMNRTFYDGGWCICIDELYYVYDHLKVQSEINRNLTQGRSEGITMVLGMQRPVSVTRFALSQATHSIAFQMDGRDAVEYAKAVGINKEVQQRLTTLGRYEFLWYYGPENRYFVGKLNGDILEPVAEKGKDSNALARQRR